MQLIIPTLGVWDSFDEIDFELVYEGKKYDLKSGDVVFIDCRKAYSHSTGNNCSTGNGHGVDNMQRFSIDVVK